MNYNDCTKMNKERTDGYLELIIGPMFSGKTSKILDLHRQYSFCNMNVMVVNYDEDTRYHETMLSTHDQKMISCHNMHTLKELLSEENIKNTDAFLINEGQFFSDVFEVIVELVDQHKKIVHVCGLDGDFQRKRFGNLLDLIPYSNDITKLSSFCTICKNGERGIFTHRLSKEKEQKLIGFDNYVPLCRKCYLNENE